MLVQIGNSAVERAIEIQGIVVTGEQRRDIAFNRLDLVRSVCACQHKEYVGDALNDAGDYTGAQNAYNAALTASRLDDGMDLQIKIAETRASFGDYAGALVKFSEKFECQLCGVSYEEPEPRLFSFNNPFGACPTCDGQGLREGRNWRALLAGQVADPQQHCGGSQEVERRAHNLLHRATI